MFYRLGSELTLGRRWSAGPGRGRGAATPIALAFACIEQALVLRELLSARV